jgi:uncharacterized protein with ParB-like and HNH nuclease domain
MVGRLMIDSVDGGLLKMIPVGDIAGDFFVPAYQRGYRWGEHEVVTLRPNAYSWLTRRPDQ